MLPGECISHRSTRAANKRIIGPMNVWVKRALAAGAIIAVGVLIVMYHREVIAFLSDEAAVQAWVVKLGPLGPLGAALDLARTLTGFPQGTKPVIFSIAKSSARQPASSKQSVSSQS